MYIFHRATFGEKSSIDIGQKMDGKPPVTNDYRQNSCMKR